MLDRAEKLINDKQYDQARSLLAKVEDSLNSIWSGAGRQKDEDGERWVALRRRLSQELHETGRSVQANDLSSNREAALDAIIANSSTRSLSGTSGVEESNTDTVNKKKKDRAIEIEPEAKDKFDYWFSGLPKHIDAMYDALWLDEEFCSTAIWDMLGNSYCTRFMTNIPDSRSNSLMRAVARLAKINKVDRARLLAHSAKRASQAKDNYENYWFCELYTLLEPSPSEQSAHLDYYTNASRSLLTRAVGWGLTGLANLYERKEINAQQIWAPLAAIINSVNDPLIDRALKLLRQVAKREKTVRHDVVHTALEAVRQNEPAAVHKSVLDIVERYGDPSDDELYEELTAKLPILKGTQLRRASDWLNTAQKVQGEKAGSAHQNSTTTESTESSVNDRSHADATAGSAATDAQQPHDPELLTNLDDFDEDLRLAAGINEAMLAVSGKIDAAPALDLDCETIPRVTSENAIHPIDNINDLLFAFMRVLERRTDGDEMERILDGVSRLNAERPPDFDKRVAQLRERAVNRLQPERQQDSRELRNTRPFSGASQQEDLAALALFWTDGDRLSDYYKVCPQLALMDKGEADFWRLISFASGINLNSFLSARMHALGHQILRKKSLPLLAAPTHKGGWIDAGVIPQRLRLFREAGEQPSRFDVAQALLRLAPNGKDEARALLSSDESELSAAFQYALGGESASIDKMSLSWLWATAARVRNPLKDDPIVADRFAQVPSDTARAAQYNTTYTAASNPSFVWRDYAGSFLRVKGFETPTKAMVSYPTYLFHCKPYNLEYEMQYPNKRVWEPLVWPQFRESYFAGEARQVLQHLTSNGKYWLTAWEPLFEPDTFAKGMARYLIAFGLAAKHEDCIRQAIDGLIATINECRLDGDSFGEALAVLVDTDLIVPGRWFNAFEDVMRISPLHMLSIKRAIEGTVAGINPLKQPPKGILNKLLELCIKTDERVTNESAVLNLQALISNGNAVKVAQSLLAYKGHDSSSELRQQAAKLALEHRINRLVRWQAARDGVPK
jgi:hypothetical protein